jgi:hypothetical protein
MSQAPRAADVPGMTLLAAEAMIGGGIVSAVLFIYRHVTDLL